MIIIPDRLKQRGIKFVLLEQGGKKPFEKAWQNKNMEFDDPHLLEHLNRGGNFGVMGGGEKNLLLVDFDNLEIQNKLVPQLPETFTVKTGSGKLHKYYKSGSSESYKIFDKQLSTLLDVQGEGKQCVGPGSLHPNGTRYEIIDDREIAFIDYAELKALIMQYDEKPNKVYEEKIRKLREYTQKNAKDYNGTFVRDLQSKVKIDEALNYTGIDTSKSQTQCPFHGSKGGKCLGWGGNNGETCHCFHCEGAWNIYSLIQDYKHCTFTEALEILAGIGGMTKELEESRRNYNANVKAAALKVAEGEKQKIEHPNIGRLISTFSEEVATHLKDKKAVFFRIDSHDIVEVGKIRLEKDKEDTFTGFLTVKPPRFITLIESHLTPGVMFKESKDVEVTFKCKSIGVDLANTVLCSQHLQDELPKINRIFTIPIPIIYEGKLTFPVEGYDPRFNSWLIPNAPKIEKPEMGLDEARKILIDIHKEFCFQNKQDFTNAISSLLTPFLRGLYPSFNTRTPVFVWRANRERSGKDYGAGIRSIIYEGMAMEDTPISSMDKNNSSSDELRKKLTSAFMQGRKLMHFSNNKGHLDNSCFESVITSEKYTDRILGKNEMVCFENEIDFSLSANVGISYTADFANRARMINLFLEVEDANSRKFENPDLHLWLKNNRGLVLSALYALVRNWIEKGKPLGTVLFTSFPQWARICGGIMESCGYDSPCNPDKDSSLTIGGDEETNEMKSLFELMFAKKPEEWITREQIKQIAINEDLFSSYDFSKKSDQTSFGLAIGKFTGRVLSDIKLIVKDKKVRGSRQEYKFSKEKSTFNIKNLNDY